MTNSSPASGGPLTDDDPIEDSDWVRSVVAAALVEANIPAEQAQRVLAAATAAPAEHADSDGPFSLPAKPQAEDWPALEAEARADATLARLEADRPNPADYFHDAPELQEYVPATSAPITNPLDQPIQQPVLRTAEPVSSTLPPLDEESTSVADLSLQDEVMVESDASVEGYRSSDLRTALEWLVVIFLALVVAVLAQNFIVQAFWIPSASMETTVNVGDRVLVNKLSYQFNDVRRGDLVVFGKVEGTQSDTEDLIKRAVALPGETIELRSDGRLWIWGPGETPDDALLLNEPYLDVQNATLDPPSAVDAPNETIWDENCVNNGTNLARCTLGEDSYFMMGDNRRGSSDSRAFGPVPGENIVGRAFFRIWPIGAISTL